jgi:type 1 fimbria pilin
MSSFISTKPLLSISLLLLLPVTGAVHAAEVSGGTVNFHGSVVTTACAISSNSADLNVELGEIRATTLKTAGSQSAAAKNFSIVLQGCDSKTSTGVAVTFTGPADKGDPTSLAVGSNGGASTAQNVAIRLYDENGAQVKLGIASGVTTLRDGDNTLNFSAKYYSAAGNVTAGDASAVATYTLTYS